MINHYEQNKELSACAGRNYSLNLITSFMDKLMNSGSPQTRKEGEQKSVDAPQDLSAFKAQLKEYLLEEGWSKADPIYLDEAVDYKTESLLALIPGAAEWSEEDEKDLQRIRKILKEQAYADYDVDEDGELCGVYKHLSNWLQSLRLQKVKEK